MNTRRELWRRLLEEARELAEKLEQHGVKVKYVLLFGSVARGDFKAESDLDLIVVSDDWDGMGIDERMGLLYRLWEGRRDATLIPLTEAELARASRRSVVVRDARATG